MKKLIFVLTLLSFQTFSQQIYQVNEVEKAAEPSGGIAFLNQFIAANIKIPIKSAAKGMNAKVFVKGIIETDGSMSALEILRSIDKSNDAEAIRLLSLYRAWKPALIKGNPVRQVTVFPVSFRTNPIPEFDSTENVIIEYFDKNNAPSIEPEKYKFRNIIPVDKFGFVRDDIQYEERRLNQWKMVKKIPYEKKEIWAHISGNEKVDSIRAFRISARMDNYESAYEEVIVQSDEKLLSHSTYPGAGRPPITGKFYFLSGMLKENLVDADGLIKTTKWYDNGHIHSILELGSGKGTVIKNVWERSGEQIVKDGNGWAKIDGSSYNRHSTYEEGKVVSGNKSGRWTTRLADSTLLFEEFYEDGKLIRGIRQDKVEYTDEDNKPAQFKGGPSKMYEFLGTNIKYPYEASRRKITGRVMISFTVLEDGTLKDYKIEKNAEKSLDEEALRVVKKSSGLWEPGTMRGEKIRVRYTLPINFDIN